MAATKLLRHLGCCVMIAALLNAWDAASGATPPPLPDCAASHGDYTALLAEDELGVCILQLNGWDEGTAYEAIAAIYEGNNRQCTDIEDWLNQADLREWTGWWEDWEAFHDGGTWSPSTGTRLIGHGSGRTRAHTG